MKIVQLSGGVGGARLARGLAALDEVQLTVVVNVGDDAENHGLVICPDLDTVVYTLAGVEGPLGWGRRDDTFALNEELARFGVDNTFRLGDRDLALKLYRTREIAGSTPLSVVTRTIAAAFDVRAEVLPVTDDTLRTLVRLDDGWVTFQEYFVTRGHRDEVRELRFDGASLATPAPGVVEAIEQADRVVIGPSNPPLSIWPILGVAGVDEAVRGHRSVVAVSPLIGGTTVKGPADRVMASLGLPPGNHGVALAYDGLIDHLVIDTSDQGDSELIDRIDVSATDTLMTDLEHSRDLARTLTSL
ncbi:MAG TPA: 2-phospho-L-lactate transferase [Acidimicrobiia bacterium]